VVRQEDRDAPSDLLEALRASVEAAQGSAKGRGKAKRKRAKSRA
jgi:non-homologous end joining protein Ku